VRLDFEKVKGVAIPIGVASKSLVARPDGHFLRDKLSDPATLSAFVKKDPAAGLKRLLDSYGRPMTLAEVKECIVGLVAEGDWQSYWTSAKKSPQVVTHGSGKTATVEWSDSADAADDMLYAKFAKAPVKEKIELFRKHAKRSPELTVRMAENLFDATKDLRRRIRPEASRLPCSSKEAAAPGARGSCPTSPCRSARLADRAAANASLEVFLEKKSPRTGQVLADWFFKEEDSRTLDFLDKRLVEVDPDARERMLDRLLKSPRSGPRAFVWFCQKATADEELRKRLTPNVLGRLLDAISWDELGATRSKVREMFDRTGLAAIWIMKHATLGDVRVFLEALGRHNELEPRRRDALVSTSEMKFPDLRKQTDDQFFVTPESLERKRKELEQSSRSTFPRTKGHCAGRGRRRSRRFRVQGAARQAAAALGARGQAPGGARARPGARPRHDRHHRGAARHEADADHEDGWHQDPDASRPVGLEARRGRLFVPFGSRQGAPGQEHGRRRGRSRRGCGAREDRALSPRLTERL
jgi:hypothetical protein